MGQGGERLSSEITPQNQSSGDIPAATGLRMPKLLLLGTTVKQPVLPWKLYVAAAATTD